MLHMSKRRKPVNRNKSQSYVSKVETQKDKLVKNQGSGEGWNADK